MFLYVAARKITLCYVMKFSKRKKNGKIILIKM